jgi:TolB-like protein
MFKPVSNRKILLLSLVTAVFLAFGCGVYTSSARLPSHLKTIYIQTFENKTNEFLLPQQIAERLVERFQEEGDLRVTSSTSADAFLDGTILNYKEEPLTYVGGGDVLQRKVRIFVSVSFIDQISGDVLWEVERMERWATYDSESEEEDDGIRRAVDKLADDVINQALKGW